MREESESGPHSYLAGYIILLVAIVLGIVGLIVYGVKKAAGEKRLETCQTRLARVAESVQAYAAKYDGRLPSSLDELETGVETHCVFSDPRDHNGHYRYEVQGRTFSLTCGYNAHADMNRPQPSFTSTPLHE